MSAPEPKGREAAWPFALGTLDDVAKRFPRSSDDATATRLAAIAKRLDTPIRMSGTSKRVAVRRRRLPFQAYLAAQIAKPDDTVDAPPAEIRQFLDEHVAAIDELRTLLAGGDVPHWAVDVEEPLRASIPDFEAHPQLFRILAADALDHSRRGDGVTAWQDARAGWTLAQGLWSQPDLISTMIALFGTRMMNEVAAKLAAPAPPWWHRELLTFDTNRAIASAMQFEAWRELNVANRHPAGEPHEEPKAGLAVMKHVAAILAHPARLRRASQDASAFREVAGELARLRSCRDAPAPRPDTVNVEGIWWRINRFRVEREAADKLLTLKEMQRASGAWPDSMPGIERSSCSDGGWRYRRETDGSMSLSFLGSLHEEHNGAAVLPPSFHYTK